jgi:hypothetical protein
LILVIVVAEYSFMDAGDEEPLSRAERNLLIKELAEVSV